MVAFLEIVRATVRLVIMALQAAMFIRAIISWFPMNENKFTNFLYAVTEPVVYPVRLLFEKMHWFEGLPIDISFFVAYLLLSMLGLFL